MHNVNSLSYMHVYLFSKTPSVLEGHGLDRA